jgi:hypothetical protein
MQSGDAAGANGSHARGEALAGLRVILLITVGNATAAQLLSRYPKVWYGAWSVIRARKRAELMVMCLEALRT